MSKDFSKFAYFVSRAKNYAIVVRPDKKKVVDGEVVFEPGLRLEFNNGMLAIERSKDNENILSILRKKISDEKDFDQKRRSLWEELPPKEMIDMETVRGVVEEKVLEKNQKIADLEKELERLKKNK